MEVIDLTDEASVHSRLSNDDDTVVLSVPDQEPAPTWLSFKLPGRPIPWRRPKVNRFGATYNTQTLLLIRIKGILRPQMAAPPFTGPIIMEIDFYFKRPKKHFHPDLYGNLVRKPNRPMNCIICRDIDNLAKLVLDSLNGIAYANDRQVVELSLRKKFSDVKYYYSDNAQIEEYTNIRIFAL
eukprot:gene8541-10126_t